MMGFLVAWACLIDMWQLPTHKPAAVLTLQGCLALMHSKGVVHADIKPENILLTSPPGKQTVFASRHCA